MSGFGYRNLGFGGGKFVAPDTTFDIPNSLRLDGTSAYLTRTPAGAGSLRKWTFSCWLKRSTEDSNNQSLFNGGTDVSSPTDSYFGFNSSQKFYFLGLRTSTATFKDFSAWYHVLVHLDTANATASQRFRAFINGEEITVWDTETAITQDADYGINLAANHGLGRQGYGGSTYTSGYLAEVHFADDALYGVSTFGETGTYGEWKPKLVEAVTYGTNGFYLDFKLSADSTVGLGKDQSGNDNDWTPTGLDTTDQMLDSPTNNFCTFNSLIKSDAAISEGNLRAIMGATHQTPYGTLGVKTGKWYWEGRCFDNGTDKFTYGVVDVQNSELLQVAGVNTLLAVLNTFSEGDAVAIYHDQLYKNGSSVVTGVQTALADTDMVGIAFDADAGKVWFHREGVWVNGSATASTTLNLDNHDSTVTTGEIYVPGFSGESSSWMLNAGQDSSFNGTETAQGNTDSNGIGDFYYAVPTDFLALCTKNLPDAPITDASAHFNTVLYTGDGTADRAVTGVGFQPDFVWMKDTDAGTHHGLFDIIRGKDTRFTSNNSGGEDTQPMLESFDVDGFTTGDHHNQDTNVHVSFNWLAGNAVLGTGDFTQGDHASTCSRNVTAGFSIVNYAASGTAGTVGHGLSAAPDFMICASRDQAGTGKIVYFGDPTDYATLNSQSARVDSPNAWNDTAPTATLFSIGADGGDTNNSSTTQMLAYVWHEVEGYTKVGIYIGNGDANGPCVYTGFKPAFLIVKNIGASIGSWWMSDNKRPGYNGVLNVSGNLRVRADTAGAEDDAGRVDFLANGFKIRTAAYAESNTNLGSYVFFAIAETPFKYSTAA